MALSEQILRAAALAAWENAASYSAEAKLLDKHGYGARAVALAILGTEEFGKAVAYTVAALSAEPLAVLVDRSRPLKAHEVKHLIVQAAEYAHIVTHEWSDVVAAETGYQPSPEVYVASR